MEESAFFRRKRVVFDRLPAYGFVNTAGHSRISRELLGGQFCLLVEISKAGRVDTRVIDTASEEEYVLHRVPGATGAFTGAVREAYEAVMQDIAEKCFEADVFKSEQAKAIIDHVRSAYGDELEYLWEKFPDNAVWRRKDNEKWYAALLTVPKRKLGICSDEMAEIIDLRADPEKLEALVDNTRFFPGWHMNKKHWYTILLDGSVPLERIQLGLEESHSIAGRK